MNKMDKAEKYFMISNIANLLKPILVKIIT